MSNSIKRYGAGQLVVSHSKSRCIFAQQCENRLRSVFNRENDPWVEPEQAGVSAVAEAVSHCPSGALTYKNLAPKAEQEQPDREASCHVQQNGPLYFRGDIRLYDEARTLSSHETRLALCRCGASQNKPYCDRQCNETGFQDLGQLTIRSTQPRPKYMTHVQIFPIKNGPLEILGTLTVIDDYLNYQVTEEKARLCRCGESKNKPFCDNSHVFSRFKSASAHPPIDSDS